jgi:hypothetical protein
MIIITIYKNTITSVVHYVEKNLNNKRKADNHKWLMKNKYKLAYKICNELATFDILLRNRQR